MKISDLYSDIIETDEVSGRSENQEYEESIDQGQIAAGNLGQAYEEFRERYEEFMDIGPGSGTPVAFDDDTREHLKDFAVELLEDNTYQEETAHRFLTETNTDFDQEGVGLFMTAIAETVEEDEMTVPGFRGSSDMDYFGFITGTDTTVRGRIGDHTYSNARGAELLVKGDVGDYLGEKISETAIEVEGDAGENVGYEMEDGEIIIQGDAESAGKQMKGGHITVNGDAGQVGTVMEQGQIDVSGDVESAVGKAMKGGIINVEGYAAEVATMLEGGVVEVESAEKVAERMSSGQILVNGDVEEDVAYLLREGEIEVVGDIEGIFGKDSINGEVHVHGEIEEIGDNCGADVYQKQNGDFELVHEGRDRPLAEGYTDWIDLWYDQGQQIGPDELYEEAMERVEDIEVDSEMVADFVGGLDEDIAERDKDWVSGIYISAAINSSEEDFFTLPETENIEYLGYKNQKDIRIEGDVADIGSEMQEGEITVEGDVTGSAGHKMEDGEITVKGSTGRETGQKMQGGQILVEGDTGIHLGKEMTDGEIVVEGHAEDSVGYQMEEGRIEVGSTGKQAGIEMSGGEVHVNGDADGQVAPGMTGGQLTIEGDAGWTGNDAHGNGVLEGGEVRIGGEFELDEDIEGGKVYEKVGGEWELAEDFNE